MTYLTTDDGVRLRYRDHGEGPGTVLLVHGWKGSHRLWDSTSVALTQEGLRVVSYDLRGMGESDKPGSGYDFDHAPDDLRDVIAALDLHDVTLVGWSMGGTISLRHLQRHGERIGGLVLLNAPLRLIQAPDFPHAMPAEQLDGYVEDLVTRWPVSEHEFQRDTLLEPHPALLDLLYGVALQTPLDVALAYVRAQAPLDMRDAVRAAAVPVMAAYSEGDPYYPTTLADWIAASAPDGRRLPLTGSGHATPLEEPRTLAAGIADFHRGRQKR
jgi:pimeloyl-ACP methyl ester carboxylesterase